MPNMFCDPGLNRSREIRHQVFRYGIFYIYRINLYYNQIWIVLCGKTDVDLDIRVQVGDLGQTVLELRSTLTL